MVGILKKTAAATLLMMIFLPGSVYSGEEGHPAESFRITDIFKYNHPVIKAENEKKWNFNLSGSYSHTKEYLAKNPLVKKTDTTYYCQASVTF